MPVFGYFMQSLLLDDRFPRYRAKFAAPKEKIQQSEWSSPAVLAIHPDSLRNDSIQGDSIHLAE